MQVSNVAAVTSFNPVGLASDIGYRHVVIPEKPIMLHGREYSVGSTGVAQTLEVEPYEFNVGQKSQLSFAVNEELPEAFGAGSDAFKVLHASVEDLQLRVLELEKQLAGNQWSFGAGVPDQFVKFVRSLPECASEFMNHASVQLLSAKDQPMLSLITEWVQNLSQSAATGYQDVCTRVASLTGENLSKRVATQIAYLPELASQLVKDGCERVLTLNITEIPGQAATSFQHMSELAQNFIAHAYGGLPSLESLDFQHNARESMQQLIESTRGAIAQGEVAFREATGLEGVGIVPVALGVVGISWAALSIARGLVVSG